MKINTAYLTDQGKIREENQDCIIIDKNIHLYCVSDGMGGLPYGKVTAEIVRDQMIAYFRLLIEKKIEITIEVIENILKKISHHIQTMGNVENGVTLYGATLTGILVVEDQVFVMNVGDSRVYQYKDATFTQLTKDQSLIQYLIDNHKISKSEVHIHPMRNAILEFMGKPPKIKPSVFTLKCTDGETYCICSDGLFSMVEEVSIQKVLENDLTLNEKCHQLVDEANHAGGKDNISIILVEIERSHYE